jgi:2-amino-4-hydroxy-6-hydroxymethyldihydropteridine diphosphokinase
LLAQLQAVEKQQGRVRDGERWGARTLDLDLLAYGAEVIATPTLTVPHPRIAERNFVLLPLRDIAPELRIPGHATVAVLAGAAGMSEPRIARLD